jgi:DNA repair protein RadC
LYLHIRDQISSLPTGGRFADLRDARLVQTLSAFVNANTAQHIVEAVGIVGLRSMSKAELQHCGELGDEDASRVIAARELAEEFMPIGPVASCVAHALVHLPPGLALLETEVLVGIALTARLSVRGTLLLSKGGIAGAAITPRDVFVPLVRLGASSFILAHNHPSGDPKPSHEDIELTEKIAHAGDLLGIELLDHIIVARSGAVSLSEEGCTSIPYVPRSLGCA